MANESLSQGFDPIARADAVTLILGSLPSKRSIESGEYFGNPRNTFWKIMGELVDAGPQLPYALRVERMMNAKIAVWDVLRCAVRPGSLDSDIQAASARPNNFLQFFEEHSKIRRVCFNGKKAAEFYERMVPDGHAVASDMLKFLTLPSTSPAHAAMTFEKKLDHWSVVTA